MQREIGIEDMEKEIKSGKAKNIGFFDMLDLLDFRDDLRYK